MPYSDQLNAIFLHVPKTGGSAVKSLLGIEQLNSENPEIIPSPQHLTCDLLKKRIGEEKYNGYYKFAFVRNPWSRMVSEYYWRQSNDQRRMDMNFAEFTCYAERVIESQDFYSRKFEDHFIPQVRYTSDIDQLFRYEQFEKGLRTAAAKLAVDIGKIRNKTPRHYDRWWLFYDTKSRDRIGSLYREDIESFGYDFANAAHP